MNCSGYSTVWICRTCGSMISLGYDNVGLGSIILWAYSIAKPTGPGGEYILPGLSCSDGGGRTNVSTVSYQRRKRKLTVASEAQMYAHPASQLRSYRSILRARTSAPSAWTFSCLAKLSTGLRVALYTSHRQRVGLSLENAKSIAALSSGSRRTAYHEIGPPNRYSVQIFLISLLHRRPLLTLVLAYIIRQRLELNRYLNW